MRVLHPKFSAMTFLSGISRSAEWLLQFDESDREAAASLIDEILLVSGEAFQRGMRRLLDEVVASRPSADGKIALYAERPVKKVFGKIPAFFPDSRHGKATGPGVQPVRADPRDQEIGSEGVVAQLITDYCRQNPEVALSHPGPDKLRADRVGHIVIVTDFIGSGKRVHDMLEAFRYVATLRSWRSGGRLKFTVVAYSALTEGLYILENQKLKPQVRLAVGCPTLFGGFGRSASVKMVDLCRRYPPRRNNPFGFRGGGALIAFAHGCPNNATAMLWSRADGWRPLFHGRSTAATVEAFPVSETQALDERAQRLLGVRSAQEALSAPTTKLWVSTMMVLAACEDGARDAKAVSGRSSLGVAETESILRFAQVARWLTDKLTMTPLGRKELARLRRRGRRRPVLPSKDSPFYYPSQLRVP